MHIELDSLRLSKEKTDKTYLSLEEIDLIEKASVELPHLLNARDWLKRNKSL